MCPHLYHTKRLMICGNPQRAAQLESWAPSTRAPFIKEGDVRVVEGPGMLTSSLNYHPRLFRIKAQTVTAC